MSKKAKSGLKGREELRKQIEKKKAEISARHQVTSKLKVELSDLMDQQTRLDRTLVSAEFLIKFFKSLKGWKILSNNVGTQEVEVDFKSAPKELQIVRRGELRLYEPAVGGVVHFVFGASGFVDIDRNPERAKKMVIHVSYRLSVGVIRIFQKHGFDEIRKNIERREIDILDDKVQSTKAMLSGEPYLSNSGRSFKSEVCLG